MQLPHTVPECETLRALYCHARMKAGCDPRSELLGNYYWVKYAVQYYDTLGTNSELVKCALWKLLSRYSVYEA